ncbi:MAG: bifunctional methylenetetrahydrofolate dehydrogenase/methenyltetrahydrofolate cyclohydrolase FolD [Lachnospiraceae bacterium]|nr:bifunctional methylenetetrahydrofolate dehydrogenase/methenyltetrahydrofolate cyclohydrolase FolD [Lachnospiraceae bacterium]
MDRIIDGKAVAARVKEEIKNKIEERGIKPVLAVILVGDDPASTVYVNNKKKACEFCGIGSKSYELPSETTEEELLKLIDRLNKDKEINGILVQLPVPKHIDPDKVIEAISPTKDVDGFSTQSAGALMVGKKGFVPCTPAGVIELLHSYNVEISGKNCVVMGRSNIVGKPMAMLMLRENATVTVTHTKTKDIKEITKRADILIAAVGKPRMIDQSYIKDGAVIIDVGIHRLDPAENNGKKLCGDVDYDSVYDKASLITPVPGGVGPMTIAMLMKNTLSAYDMQNKSQG